MFLLLNKNIPNGAITSEIDKTFIITELKLLKKSFNKLLLQIDIALPRSIEKIICNILPFTNDSNGLLGIKFKNTSLNFGASFISKFLFANVRLKFSPGFM